MTPLWALLGVACASAGSMLFYLVAPAQKYWPHPRPPGRWIALGGATWLVSLIALRQVLGPAASVYALLILAMVLLSALPFLAALAGRGRR